MQKIGRYEILEELGRGSMGVVFKARDPQIGREVAIKLVLTANLSKDESELYRTRFFREAQAAGKMSHPGIITIHDIAEDESGQPYLVMEYVEGASLHKLLRPDPHGKIKERFPLERTLDLCAQVGEALDYAHSRGVVHRDVKPSNVMVTPDGRAKIADFGIARLSGTEATHTASITGTPAYMSPEQFRGGMIDSRSDIFSLGAMLYWMATGEKAFPGENVTQVSFNVVYREPAPARSRVPDLPTDLEVVLSRCLAKRPENRYEKAGEAAADLRALLAGKPVTATTAPAESTVEDTVVTMQSVTPVGKPLSLAESASTETALPPVKATRTSLTVLAATLVLAATVWFWQRTTQRDPGTPQPVLVAESSSTSAATASAPSKQGSVPSAVPSATSPAPIASGGSAAAGNSTPSPAGGNEAAPAPQPPANTASDKTPVNAASKVATPSAPRKSAIGTGAILALDCKHNFKDAEIQIRAGEQVLLDAKLEGKPGGFFGRTGGTFIDRLDLRPGKHSILVKVHSAADKYIEEEKIEGEFAVGKTQTLEIRFGRGSAFGKTRDLTLKWKK